MATFPSPTTLPSPIRTQSTWAQRGGPGTQGTQLVQGHASILLPGPAHLTMRPDGKESLKTTSESWREKNWVARRKEGIPGERKRICQRALAGKSQGRSESRLEQNPLETQGLLCPCICMCKGRVQVQGNVLSRAEPAGNSQGESTLVYNL